MVVVMGDVFALVYNFHMPLSLKIKTVRLVELVAIYFGSLSLLSDQHTSISSIGSKINLR
jgi:hypothetical protein